ncbi:uncharacterized protein LOC129012153 [Pongo pygmaeus]|uniref:uncharacterized protein LOC129012153 n=1 Tax=Pongo pygmaeus TaxID=9600 RepID=UPI00300D4C45
MMVPREHRRSDRPQHQLLMAHTSRGSKACPWLWQRDDRAVAPAGESRLSEMRTGRSPDHTSSLFALAFGMSLQPASIAPGTPAVLKELARSQTPFPAVLHFFPARHPRPHGGIGPIGCDFPHPCQTCTT